MAEELLNKDLRAQIELGQVIAIVGAGVSMGATNGNPLASWTGLLEDGVTRCWEVAQPLPDAWRERVLAEIDSGDLDDLLSAAEKVSSKLDAPHGGEYRSWLRETVGSLKTQHRGVIEALHALGVKLATTNYDGLIEEVTGLPPVTWAEGAKVERVIRDDDQGIFHLHGHWDQPESVILGIRSYAMRWNAHSTRRPGRALKRRCLSVTKSLTCLGEANCILRLGDIALESSQLHSARARFEEALQLFTRISEPYSIGTTHRRLARLASDTYERTAHVNTAIAAWEQIQRDDLIAAIKSEFGGIP
jgi:hypothetical protein